MSKSSSRLLIILIAAIATVLLNIVVVISGEAEVLYSNFGHVLINEVSYIWPS